MPRGRYPSDEARLKTRPHVKVHLTVASHRRTAAAWADPEMRGMLVELWRVAAEAFAGRTGDRVCLSPAAVRSITGRERHFTGVSRLRTVCSRVGYELVTDGSATFVTIRNFSKKQRYDSAIRGATPHTPHPSDSDSDSEEVREEEERIPKKESAAGSPAVRVSNEVDSDFKTRGDPKRWAQLFASDLGGQEPAEAFVRGVLPQIEAGADAEFGPAEKLSKAERAKWTARVRERLHAFVGYRKSHPEMQHANGFDGSRYEELLAQARRRAGVSP